MTVDAELAGVVESALADAEVPGCALAIAHDGTTWTGGFGLANAETGLAFTAATRVPICSMTKPFTATLVLALVEQGLVELDAPVRRYLPDFRVADATAAERVTVRRLLDHTAGWIGDLDGQDSADTHALDRGDDALRRQVERMAGYRQVSPPGRRWSYANSAYVVAGRLAEAVGGASYETLMRERVFAPLGLLQTTLFAELAITHPVAVGHTGGAGAYEVVRWPWNGYRRYAPAGSVVSTAEDQLRWHRWWLGVAPEGATADPLTTGTRERMLSETVPGGCFCDEVGLGWMIDRHDGARVVHHAGSGWGIQTHGLFAPEADFALVLLTNARPGFRAIARIRAYALERFAGLREPQRPALAPDAAALAEYAGSYRLPAAAGPEADERMEVAVAAGGDGLVLRLPAEDDGEQPPPIAAQVFRRDETVMRDGPLAGLRTEFLRDRQGALDGLRFGGRIWLRERAS